MAKQVEYVIQVKSDRHDFVEGAIEDAMVGLTEALDVGGDNHWSVHVREVDEHGPAGLVPGMSYEGGPA